ncbi:UNVERIFIED_CONTAM: hypothetical protein Scaly_0983000 [Sesamum calycinum]|uniref:SWIM-type domain-containing protein n=1 Tax=Sesamum calycinum TaxID=2727403 RepID=A0AAW2QZ09_9LAMI
MSQQWGEANPQMSNQWGEYMTLSATPGLPSCSNTDYLAGTSNLDFGAGTSNPDFGAENFIPHENDAEDPIGDSLVNESDEASKLDEAEYPIPLEDGPDHVDINVMAETFAQGRAETSSEPALPDRTTQPTFYRSIPFFEQTLPEIPANSVDVPNLMYGKFYNKSEGRLDKRMLFKTKKELMKVVQDHSIRHARREYYVTESSKTKWKVLCKHSTEEQWCRWELQGHVKCNPSYEIKHVIQNVNDQTRYDVPYQKAWYSLKMAREIVYSTWDSSVRKLPKYLGAIQKYNPRTIVEWKHKAFQQSTGSYVLGYVLWAFKLCIDGFQFCRKIINVDDTHLYTKYKHKLLIAAAMDGNQQINKEKWTASHDGGWRCSILTTNMSVCINGVMKGLAACRVIKCYKTTNCGRISHARCSYLGNKKSVEHTVTKYSHSQQSASVVTRRQNGHGMNTHVVKIANRECSCGKWNQFGIPCSHAQKVCGAYNISAASMVKDYYDLMAYNNTYSKHFEPLQSEDYWDDPNFQLVHDPTIRISTRPGRNQTTRIHNEMDWRQTRARQEAQQQGDS